MLPIARVILTYQNQDRDILLLKHANHADSFKDPIPLTLRYTK